jgi:predicted transcriptional regulator
LKKIEQVKAVQLRIEGYSLSEIRNELGVAKSSVSLWVRNVELTETQKMRLRQKGFYREAVEKRRTSRLANEKIKRDLVINAAQKSIKKISRKQLWLIGVMLYWAEGGKTQKAVRFSNSDPEMIKIMMVFFRDICEVPEAKFRGHIHIHPHLDYKEAEKYWSIISGIPLDRVYKTYRMPNKSSLNKKDTLPYGTFDVYVLNVELFYKITGWAKGIFSSYK